MGMQILIIAPMLAALAGCGGGGGRSGDAGDAGGSDAAACPSGRGTSSSTCEGCRPGSRRRRSWAARSRRDGADRRRHGASGRGPRVRHLVEARGARARRGQHRGQGLLATHGRFRRLHRADTTITVTLDYAEEPGGEKVWVTAVNPPTLGGVFAGFRGTDVGTSRSC